MNGMAQPKNLDFVLRIVLDQLEERAEGANQFRPLSKF